MKKIPRLTALGTTLLIATLGIKGIIGKPLASLNSIARNIGNHDENNNWVLDDSIEIGRWLVKEINNGNPHVSNTTLDEGERVIRELGVINYTNRNIWLTRNAVLKEIERLRKIPEGQRTLVLNRYVE